MSTEEKRRRVVSRRSFLRGMGAAAAGLLATGCCPRALIEAVESTATAEPTVTPVPTAVPTHTPTATLTAVPSSTPTGAPTATPTGTPTAVPTSVPTATPEPAFRSRVAIGRVDSYDRTLIRQQVEALLDGIGGLGDVVGLGDRVAIKVNLTGGNYFQPPEGVLAVESYFTHPEVVRALGELLRDAGAGELFIVEAIFDPESYAREGYVDVAGAVGATLLDLNSPHPYADFTSTPVGSGAFIYDSFVFNCILEEVDVFVSVAKMKCHCSCGVTHAMKNLVGLVPTIHYRLQEDHWWRSALHGHDEVETRTRLPRAVVDLNRARPIDLAVIDGIKTAEGGEVPREGFAQVMPGVLIAGKDPVAADAVATAVMGFDPTAEYPAAPFLHSDNHLNLAAAAGLGTNHLGGIAVVGAAIDDVRYPFNPCW